MTLDSLRRRSRAIALAALTIAIAGAASALDLHTSLFPSVVFPRIVVRASAGDRPADRMMVETTRLLELAVRSVPGVRRIRSTTSRGSCEISADFRWGADMISTELLVSREVEAARARLPAGAAVDVRRMDPTVFPVLGMSLTGEGISQAELRDAAERWIVPVLSRIEGVARVEVLGGDSREAWVEPSPEKLAARGLTVDDLVAALSRVGVARGAGWISEEGRLSLVLAETGAQGRAELGDVVVRGGGAAAIRVSDVATVVPGATPRYTRVTADGAEAVLVDIHRQPAGDTVAISREVREAAERLRPRLPKGARFAVYYDQADLIIESMRGVRGDIAIGLCLAAAVLLAFLRSVRATAIAVMSVLLSLAATALVLDVLGLGFDVMTLGGIAAAIGPVIDDAIVVIEHAAAVRARGAPASEAAGLALSELGASLPGSSLATAVVLLPLAFLDGVAGAFFRPLAVAMAAALCASLVASAVVVPLLAGRALVAGAFARSGEGRIIGALGRGCERAARFLLRRPLVSLTAAVLILAPAGVVALDRLGTGFLPELDEGGFVLDYLTEPGTSLEETDRILAGVEKALRETPEVLAYSRRTGVQLGGGLTEANEGDFSVRLTPRPRRGLDEVMDDVRERVNAAAPGLDVELVKLMSDLIGDLSAVPQPIEVKLFGDDLAALEALAPGVATRVAAVRGVVDVVPRVVVAGDALLVRLDPARLALAGVPPDEALASLEGSVDGTVATSLVEGERLVGVRVRLPAASRAGARDVRGMLLRGRGGVAVPLERVADIEPLHGQTQITREDLKPFVAVTARIAGRDLGGAVEDVRRALETGPPVPPGVEVVLGGLYEEQQRSFRGLAIALAAALALTAIVLVALFESYAAAIAVLVVSALSLPGALLALLATDTPLNVGSIVGMVMVVGLVAESAIFLVHEARRRLDAGEPAAEAIAASGRVRLRQSLMTTLAGGLALMPLALGVGAGSEMLRPLAIAVLGGLALKTLLLVLVLPAGLGALGFGAGAPAARAPSPGWTGG